jgi:addiction module HigA family antidote
MRRKLKPVHPGAVLREDFLKPLNLAASRLAIELHTPVSRINDIVRERRAVTADTALRLGRYFGTSPQFWMNLQTKYDLDVAEDRGMRTIGREVRRAAAADAHSI